MTDDRFVHLPKVFGAEIGALFNKLEELDAKRADLLEELKVANEAIPAARVSDTKAASQALIKGEEPPEATALPAAEQTVARIETNLHVNLRNAFAEVEQQIAHKVREEWDSWRTPLIKQRDEKRWAEHGRLAQLSDLLQQITEFKAALDWAEQPMANDGTLKRVQVQPVVLTFGPGDGVPLEKVFHRLGLALSDEPQPRPGVSYAPRPQDGEYHHTPPQQQKKPRRVVVSTQKQAQEQQDAKRHAERVGVAT